MAEGVLTQQRVGAGAEWTGTRVAIGPHEIPANGTMHGASTTSTSISRAGIDTALDLVMRLAGVMGA
jgi:hypothetical protein